MTVIPISGGSHNVHSTPRAGGGVSSSAAVFSYPGLIHDGVESPPFILGHTITYLTARISRLQVGSFDVSVDIVSNGSVFTTLTLPAGLTTTSVIINLIVPNEIPLTVRVLDQGDGSNITVILEQ